MGEIITLSYGLLCNNTVTHLYNTQESLISYKPSSKANHDLQVFLTRYKSTSVSYSPRALIYDLRNGLGALNKYEYHEPLPVDFNLSLLTTNTTASASASATNNSLESGYNLKKARVEKNEYQQKLDQGITDGSLLNVNNTKYWTDYNKLIYNPKSLTTVNNFVHNEKNHESGYHYNFDNLKYDLFNIGQEEFKACNNDNNGHGFGDGDSNKLIENFRYFLEKTDKLQGLQLLTNLNDAWGGFTNEMLIDLIDEFFNNTSSDKLNLWIYGLMNSTSSSDKTQSIRSKLSFIKTFIELTKQLSLVFPMNLNGLKDVGLNNNYSILTDKFNLSSNWHQSSLYATFINSIWGLNNQLKNQINMTHLQNDIVKLNPNQKIINQIKFKQKENKHGHEQQQLFGSDVNQFNLKDIVNLQDLNSFGKSSKASDAQRELNLGISKNATIDTGSDTYHNFVQNSISASTAEDVGILRDEQGQNGIVNNYINSYIGNIFQVETFPVDILKSSSSNTINVITEFNVNDGLKHYLKPYIKLVANVRNQHREYLDIIEDKEELLEDLNNISQEYSYGYESDDEYYE